MTGHQRSRRHRIPSLWRHPGWWAIKAAQIIAVILIIGAIGQNYQTGFNYPNEDKQLTYTSGGGSQ